MPYVRIFGFVGLLLSLFALAPAEAGRVRSADQVFQFHAERAGSGQLRLAWIIAPGHYLYRSRISAAVNGSPVSLETKQGETKDDPNFGPTEIYRQSAEAMVAMGSISASDRLIVTYQGCAEDVLCYPPVSKSIDLSTLLVEEAPERGAGPAPPTHVAQANPVSPTQLTQATAESPAPAATVGIQSETAALLGQSLFSTLVAFFGFGILLSLTPCVFPMIPIMSGMLARAGGDLSTRRSFSLSAAYVLAMAAAYGVLGIFAAWSGENLQAVLQTPVAIFVMSALFALLALSMFGVYELQLPQSWTSGLAATAGNRGSVGGAAVLGFGSALIVGPCVTPPLAAALVYVAQTGQVVRGSLALFSLGLGMGLPLFVFGVLGAKFLPRSGPWLARVKDIFGFIFIALSIWMISRVAPARVVAAAWGVLFLSIGGYFLLPFVLASRRRSLEFAAGAIGALAIVCGGAVIVGAATDAHGLLHPLQTAGLIAADPVSANNDGFQVATSEAGLADAIRADRMQSKAIMVDFSAEWCTECKLMDRNVFSQEAVRRKLQGVLLVRADLTAFDQKNKDLMKRFAIVGPPTIVFLKPDGTEIQEARVVGDIGMSGFLSKLDTVLR